MAYFANGTEGEVFGEQCSRCEYEEKECPIQFVQVMYNYDACNNETATKILDHLVKPIGTCRMFEVMQQGSDRHTFVHNPKDPANLFCHKCNKYIGGEIHIKES